MSWATVSALILWLSSRRRQFLRSLVIIVAQSRPLTFFSRLKVVSLGKLSWRVVLFSASLDKTGRSTAAVYDDFSTYNYK